MPKTTKKVLCTTAITAILNLSLQPAYAGKSDLPLSSEELSYTQKVSHHLTKKGSSKEEVSDPGLEDPQTNFTSAPQTPEEDIVSWFFSAPLKTMIGAVSLVKQGVSFALRNPGKTMTMGLVLQARTVASTLSLSGLTPNQGLTITGSGWSVSSAGDFNGDGLNDVIIGAPSANSYAGNSYVIYGTNRPPPSISLSSLMPNQGFAITGAAASDGSGYSVSSAGDFNGDGFNDIIIGAYRANNDAGKSYVIYGTNSTPPSLNLSSLTPLQGLTITGAAANDQSGVSVSSAGDFNGDGFNDVIIGAPDANNVAGKSYVIYGTNTPSSISLSSLTAAQGFTISGAAADDGAGTSVSSTGDFNGDGLGDLIIGAFGANSYAGKSYVIYGTNSPPSSISLSSLTAAQGFAITGTAALDYSGSAVSSAGDFNGDGFNDVIIGALGANSQTGKSYVIYGTNNPPSSISLTSLTPNEGFAITGAAGDASGVSVSSAGDFNGDGLNDVIIGALGANSGAGKSYVIYGTNTPSSISLSSLTAAQGFTIGGAAASDESGHSVSSAGDFNGDGLNDVIIGAPGAGQSYVIYGAPSPAPSPASPSTTGIMTTSSPNTGGQPAANEAPSQSLSAWLAGAALLIGQERF